MRERSTYFSEATWGGVAGKAISSAFRDRLTLV